MSAPVTTVLYLGLYATIGGAERAWLELIAGLDRRRFRPLVVLPEEGAFAAALRAMGVPVALVSFPRGPLHRLALPWVAAAHVRAAARLRRLARAEGASVVHCGDLAGLLLGLPLVLGGARCVYQVSFVGGSARRRLLAAAAGRFVHAVVAYSRDQLEALGPAGSRLSEAATVVAPGIAPAAFAGGDRTRFRSSVGVGADETWVGLVGRYDTWKGHAVFLEAAARVRAVRGDVRFAMIGGALNADALPHVARYREGVLALRRRLGLEAGVDVVDHRADVADVLAALDVIVVPSDHEPFGMIVLEALAAGTPVVASDSGGPAEILEDGRSGLLFRTGDAEALAERLLSVLADDAARGRLAAAGRARVAARYGRERYAREMEALYVPA